MNDLSKIQEIYGPVIGLTTPSGHTVVIRKQNGEDDDILTNSVYAQKGTATARFLAGIIVEQDFFPGRQITWEEVAELRSADSYFLVIASRMFSLGVDIHFSYKWPDMDVPVDYIESLNDFVWDYSKEFPFEGDKNYNKNRIEPINKESKIVLNLKSGKIVELDYMSLNTEMAMVNLPPEKRSINAELLVRNITEITNGTPQKVEHFRFFSPDDMKEIRSSIKRLDKPVAIFSEIEHPETKEVIEYPILSTTDFFFPREI